MDRDSTAHGTDPSAAKPLDALREQLEAAAQEFATANHPARAILSTMVDDVARGSAEALEIFPVCHHSPSSALQLVRRLRSRPPRVLFMEMCEDLRGTLDGLRECKLPVALQAFAQSSDAFPKGWSPLSVVAPLTEFSAEFQAIAYALDNPGTQLVFVDRAVDFVFQWLPQTEEELEKHLVKDEEQDDAAPPAAGTAPSSEEEEGDVPSHGSAIGVQLGEVEPTFEAFLSFLLRNARVRHFAEWWDQYVEQAVLGADYATYRYVLMLVGSLLRRLGRRDKDHESDCKRERYMWTRMKEYLQAHNLAPSDAMYICGAVHAVSDVPEFGTRTDARWEVPARTPTKWLYGLIPSSFVAIEHQFRHPFGTVSLAENTWNKGLAALGCKPFTLSAKTKPAATPAKGKAAKAAAAPPAASGSVSMVTDAVSSAPLASFLTRPPKLLAADEEQLLHWSVEIVSLARKNGYLASTADAIAIYQTAMLLANLRNRRHPSPYDFEDAAVTCLEKDRSVKKRNVQRLCQILMGGNRSGQVGYAALPPLAQDVYDRLAPLGVNLKSTRYERALIDLKKRPDLLPCSDLLWIIHYLTGGHHILRPIMGERQLGSTPEQESWEVGIGKYQEALIRLGYEGITAEHVLERRLKNAAFGPANKTVHALKATHDCILLLKSVRLSEELGERAVDLLRQETSAQDAPETVERVRRLVHYYRATPSGLPQWLKNFVATGYSHYSMLLPTAFGDRGARPEQVAGMLSFVFDFEPQALSLGCQRSQLEIAIRQAGPVTDDPAKIGLLWAAEWLLKLRDVEEIRHFLDQALDNPLMLPVFPQYVSGFLLALGFAPAVGRLVVELLSKAFARLPEEILYPWLPSLLLALRPYKDDLLPKLVKEASGVFPKDLKALAAWQPPWERASKSATAAPAAAPGATPAAAAPAPAGEVALSEEERAVVALLKGAPGAAESLGALLVD